MKVIVASGDPFKVKAVMEAFGSQFTGGALEVVGIDAASGAREPPNSDAETRERFWHQRGKSRYKGLALEDHVRGAIAIRRLQGITLALPTQRQPLGSDRRP